MEEISATRVTSMMNDGDGLLDIGAGVDVSWLTGQSDNDFPFCMCLKIVLIIFFSLVV